MTLPLPPTLVSLRNSVAIRAGLASSGNLAARSQDLLDELLIEAQKEIYLRAQWARLWRTADISLVTGQRDYDIPSDLYIGTIGELWVYNNETPSRPFPVKYEDSIDAEWLSNPGTSQGRPLVWKILNDLLRIAPEPDATIYPTLQLHYQQAPSDLVSDQSRASIDGEALIRLATIRLKIYLGIGGPQDEAMAAFQRYLYDLRAASSPARSYDMASQRLMGPAYWTQPSVDAFVTPYVAGWNPPGGGW
jgi:hypothetical protein